MIGKTSLGRDIVDAMLDRGYRLVANKWDSNIVYLQNSIGVVLKIEISEAKPNE